MILENAGHSVLEAASAMEAIAQFDAQRPGVVVMDLRIPLLEDGIRLIQRISETRPVIVLSGSASQLPGVVSTFRTLSKPCRSSELLSAIADAAAQ
jgi:CheY-like chemotaxis protein